MTISSDDKIAIHELCARTYLAIDGNDAGGFANCFAPDGIFVAPYGEFAGSEAIRTFMERHIAAGKENGVRHIVTNHIVEAHEREARSRFHIIKMHVTGGSGGTSTAPGRLPTPTGETDSDSHALPQPIEPRPFRN